MKLNFCTLFNTNYLTRGLLTYRSLLQNCPDFHLYVFAFDAECYNYLKTQNLPKLTVVSLHEFEDPELLKIKSSRSATEYCWTCTPSIVLYSIEKFSLENCIYIDADLCFYANPQVLWDEMNGKSVLITEHRYTQEYDQSAASGIYCVQFVGFKNDIHGMNVLRWWRNACLDWCFAREEAGKFGDQKYLDNWLVQFEGVYVLKHLGGGLAPWNVQQYKFSSEKQISGIELKTNKQFIPVFFHFHGVKFYKTGVVSLAGSIYQLSNSVKDIFYLPYIKQLVEIENEVKYSGFTGNCSGVINEIPNEPPNFLALLKRMVKQIIGKKHGLKLYNNFVQRSEL